MIGSAIVARKILIKWQMFPSIKLPTKVIPQKRKRKAASEKSKKDLLKIVKL